MRLLLVEDEPALSHSLKQTLAAAGYAIDQAFDGVEGEYLGLEEPYDGIILDLGLPKRNGLEVLQNWRAAGITVPVLILTARDSWQERVEGLEAGADDYLGKPFHQEELIARVRAMSRRGLQSAPGVLQCGKLRLDEQRQQCFVDDQVMELTGVEFKLLRYFMINDGKVLSKTKLTEHIYDYDDEKDSNVIEVYIRKLRKKLGASAIATLRGQGYRLNSADIQ